MTEVDRITTSVMAVQITLNHLEAIKHTKYFKGRLKQKLNNILPDLVECEKEHYDAFYNVLEESTSQVYDVYDTFIKEMAKVPIYDCENLMRIYEAYQKSPNSIEGIVNKILDR